VHGGVLLGKTGLKSKPIQPKYAAFFNSTSSTTFGYISFGFAAGSSASTFALTNAKLRAAAITAVIESFDITLFLPKYMS
jgi:hypothetical protein